MPGSLSTSGRTLLMNAMFRPEAFAAISDIFVALTTSVPVSTDSGDTIAEPVASSYARGDYGVGSYFWTLNGPGQLLNAHNIEWINPTDDWGQVTGWALCTESMSGMVVASGPLRRSMTITAGMRLRIPPGVIRLTCQ